MSAGLLAPRAPAWNRHGAGLFVGDTGGKPRGRKCAPKGRGEPMAQAEFIKVQKFLSGVHYPATKQELVDHARGKKADKDALDALRQIPDQEYGGPNEVSRAVAKDR